MKLKVPCTHLAITLSLAFFSAGLSCAPVAKEAHRIKVAPSFLVYKGKTFRAYSERSLFEKGVLLYEKGKYAKAAGVFEDLVATSTDEEVLIPSLFNLSLSYYNMGEVKKAIDTLKVLIDYCYPRQCTEARETLSYFLLEEGKVQEAEKLLNQIDWSELPQDLYIQHMINLSYLRILKGNTPEARNTLYNLIRDMKRSPNYDHYFLALAYHLIGESYREDFITQASQVYSSKITSYEMFLEELAQQILLAQKYFLKSVEGGYQIATASLFKLGTMYRDFYTIIMNIPVPEDLTEEEQKVYVEELKKAISPLLEKASIVYEKNLELYSRFGIDNKWIRETRQALQKLRVHAFSGS